MEPWHLLVFIILWSTLVFLGRMECHHNKRELIRLQAMEEGRAMDSRIREQLSLDLVEKMIASLSFSILFQCQVVCRKWDMFIFSQKFQAMRGNGFSWADLSPRVLYLFLFFSIGNTLACTTYYPYFNWWLSMPAMSCLPSQTNDVVASKSASAPCRASSKTHSRVLDFIAFNVFNGEVTLKTSSTTVPLGR